MILEEYGEFMRFASPLPNEEERKKLVDGLSPDELNVMKVLFNSRNIFPVGVAAKRAGFSSGAFRAIIEDLQRKDKCLYVLKRKCPKWAEGLSLVCQLQKKKDEVCVFYPVRKENITTYDVPFSVGRTFRAKVDARLEILGKRRKELQELTGIPEKRFMQCLKEPSRMTLMEGQKIAVALQVSLDYLVNDRILPPKNV